MNNNINPKAEKTIKAEIPQTYKTSSTPAEKTDGIPFQRNRKIQRKRRIINTSN